MSSFSWLIVWNVAACLVASQALGREAKKALLENVVVSRFGHCFRSIPKGRSQADVRNGTIVQPLDHFNSDISNTWQQYYYYNLKFYVKGGPLFLFLGGESPTNGELLTDDARPLMVYAKKFHAAVYNIEHRFYGKSQPMQNQTTENLRYLSSLQALADAANFIKEITAKEGYTGQPWIVFGCSYSGALALWFRELYPDLVVGAIGSSAPVQATVDFQEFFIAVETALRNQSAECANAVSDGFAKLSELMWTPEGRNEIDELFRVRPALNETKLRYKDIHCLMSSLIAPFANAAMENRLNFGALANAGGIPEMCEIMLNESMTPVQRLARCNAYAFEYDGGKFGYTHADYDLLVEFLKNENGIYDADGAREQRNWQWQLCTELGFFMSTDHGRNIFHSVVPGSFALGICPDVFGSDYSALRIKELMLRTNARYGGQDHYKGTNVVIVNGDFDPYHVAGILHSTKDSVVTHLSHGTGHCADILPASLNDAPGLTTARQLIVENLAKWIAEGGTSAMADALPLRNAPLPKDFLRRMPISAASLHPYQSSKKEEPTSTTTPYRSALPRLIAGHRVGGFLRSPESFIVNGIDVSVGLIKQPIDHYSIPGPGLFLQRYWKASRFAQPGGPFFLLVSEDSAADPQWLFNDDSKIMASAKRFNATVYMLEHRYYGESQPAANLSTDNLRYLTFDQAVLDISSFITAINSQQEFSKPKWVLFGCAYGGRLSAYFRAMDSSTAFTVGAVASSAPLDVKVDFFEYLLVTANSFAWYDSKCSKNISDAFEATHQLVLTAEGRAHVSDVFRLDPPWTVSTTVHDIDVQYFFFNVFSTFQEAAQYNNVNNGLNSKGGNIKDICGIMSNDLVPLVQRLANVVNYTYEFYSGKPFTRTDNSYQHLVDFFKQESIGAHSSSRSRLYQACTQFGLFPSSDTGEVTFGSATPVNLFVDLCADVFGTDVRFTPTAIYEAIKNAHLSFGMNERYSGTNVVFTNGKIDPFYALGGDFASETVVTRTMKDTARCAEMYPYVQGESPELQPTRELIDDQIAKWIGLPTNRTASTTDSTATPKTDATVTPKTSSSSVNVSWLSSRLARCWFLGATVLLTSLLC